MNSERYNLDVDMDYLEQLRGKQVCVTYEGLVYQGTLVGASESEIYLKTSTEWVSLPMEGISDVKSA